jgi:hypothetical protein
MRCRQLKYWFCLLVAALLAGCASPGVPLPPSLELARPVNDLRAHRKGDKVYLTWSVPTQTTDRQNLRHGGIAEVCRAIGAAIKTCGTPIARVPFQSGSRKANTNKNLGSYPDELPLTGQVPPTSEFVYALSILNPYGRSAGLSNQVQVPAAPTLQPPSEFRAQLTAEGVQLSWDAVTPPEISGLRCLYRVYRREQGSKKDAIAGELPVSGQESPSLLDHSFEWEKTYDYRLTIITIVVEPNGGEQQVEGEDTPSERVVAHDVFPPAAPSGLQAVFSGPGQKPFIDLVWTPNTEPDLAGYNVYRREEGGGEAVKLNSDLIKSPAFRDNEVLPGHKYVYSISAVDVRGNESPRSEEANESVPPQ